MYLFYCRDFKILVERGFFVWIQFSEFFLVVVVLRYCWFMKVYQIDVLNCVDYIKVYMMLQFGIVFKMDLINKIINKFVGRFFEKKIYVNELYIVGVKVKYFFILVYLKKVNEIFIICIM